MPEIPAPLPHPARPVVKPMVEVEVFTTEKSVSVNGILFHTPLMLAMLGGGSITIIVLLAVEASRLLGLTLLLLILVLPCIGMCTGQVKITCADARVQNSSEHVTFPITG